MFRKNRKHEQPSLLSDIGLMASNFFSVGSRLPILAKHIPVVNVLFLQQSHQSTNHDSTSVMVE